MFSLFYNTAVKEKRGYRESRLLESVNKMVLETKEQMQMSNMEASAQQLSEIHKRCKFSTWLQVLGIHIRCLPCLLATATVFALLLPCVFHDYVQYGIQEVIYLEPWLNIFNGIIIVFEIIVK